MIDVTTIFIAAVFVLAGMTKGVIGLGLSTISVGLLATVMAPVEAAAILVLPSFVTKRQVLGATGPRHAGRHGHAFGNRKLAFRIGINSGPVVAGVIGSKEIHLQPLGRSRKHGEPHGVARAKSNRLDPAQYG
jgi:class 3 adenylate cyclase